MKRIGFLLIFLAISLFAFQTVRAQTSQPLVIVMTADGPIEPAMQEYIERGIKIAEQRNAEALVIQLDTPGGSIGTMDEIITDIRASTVPVIIYVTPRGAMAASAGTLITLAGHASAMAPETIIGAASPVDSSGGDLDPTLKAKQTEALKAKVRSLAEQRGAPAVALAEDMIDNARAVSADEALKVHLVDFIASDLNDLLKKLDGFSITMPDGRHTLHTANAITEPADMTLIEELLLILTDSNIVFILLSLGVLALQIELSHPGAWVPGFVGVVCLALAFYGMGILNVNWFGLIFIITAFVLFILDLKAPTHGALTTAGVGAFIVGALVLFNSPGVPQFQRVSVPLVIGVGVFIGLMFAGILTYALRAQRNPIQFGAESYVGKTGYAKTDVGLTGQVQVESELWTAEAAQGSGAIGKGDRVEVVEVKGLRLKVRKV
ncbi:MAG: nodulation protein NfeD [Chloroflexi bacterium]|nr:nodulation protein NfeD [Chloroflexota bacterium]